MKLLSTIIFTCALHVALAQGTYTIQQAIDAAKQNNASLKAAAYDVKSQEQLKRTSFDLPKTNVSLLYGQYNSFARNDNNITVSQTIPFTAFGGQAAYNRALVASAILKRDMTENDLLFQVKQVYYQLAYTVARQALLVQQDSILGGFLKSANLRYKTGEANLLEKTTAETQSNEIRNQLNQIEADVRTLQSQLQVLVGTKEASIGLGNELYEAELKENPDTSALAINPSLAYIRQQAEVAKSEKKLQAARFAPDLQLGFFNQTLIDVPNPETGALATPGTRFTGFQVGLAIPLWFVPHQARVKSAASNRDAALSTFQYQRSLLDAQFDQAMEQYSKSKKSVDYYRTSALLNADLILKQSQTSFQAGEIGFAEYLLSVRSAVTIKDGYLTALNDLNQSVVFIEYLTGNK
jgi:cobalt-zinc-cadmium resistance protein CzcA